MRKFLLLGLIPAFFSCGFATTPRTDSIAIRFNLSRSYINPQLADNARQLSRLIEHIKNDSATRQHTALTVFGGASPEGPTALNRELSEKRAQAIADFIGQHSDKPDSLIHTISFGADWEGLKAYVLGDTLVPYREEVLSFIDRALTGKSTDGDENMLFKNLAGGRPFSYLKERAFPPLRESHVVFTYTSVADRFPPADYHGTRLSVDLPPVSPEPPLAPSVVMKDVCRPLYIGLKTNLLYDALALPSVGIDWYVGRNWSVTASWTYGWWDKDSSHRYWRAYGGDIAVRRWFGKKALEKPLTGHHLGVYGGVVTYDFEFGGKGYMGGLPGKSLWSRCNFMAGVEYGYSLPISRRLNIDFSIGFGWLGGKVIEYEPRDGYYIWEKTRNFNWIGPTKAEISLVWLVGCGNFNKQKGGSR